MDILISSNLERLIFEANNRDAEKTKKLMEELNEKEKNRVSIVKTEKESEPEELISSTKNNLTQAEEFLAKYQEIERRNKTK